MVAALAVLGGGLAVTGSPAYGAPGHAGHRDAVREGAKDLVREDGFPAALVAGQGRDGRVRDYTAGTGDLATGASVPVDGQVRAGSNTKALTAAVVLQLVGEGKVKLDEPIETTSTSATWWTRPSARAAGCNGIHRRNAAKRSRSRALPTGGAPGFGIVLP
ncbi:serine hydrolase [Streptomyces tendae]